MKAKLFGLITGRIIKVTPGGRHAWYESNLGYPIRKEIGEIKKSFNSVKFGPYTPPSVDVNALAPEKKSYVWRRLKSLLRGWGRLWAGRFKKWVKEIFHFGRKGGS